MSFDYKYVLPPTGQPDSHILREMFDDIKAYINDTDNFDFASKALDNLASVAINTSLISDTDNTDDLGSSTKGWKDLYLAGDLKVGSNIVLSPNTDGSVNRPLQPSFLVVDGTGAADVTGDGTVYTQLWPTEIYDQGGNFASNTFTAPVTGRYLLTASVRLQNLLTTHQSRAINIVTSNRTVSVINLYTLAETYWGHCVSAIVDMDANDTATITVNVTASTKTVDITGSVNTNFFSGSLIN